MKIGTSVIIRGVVAIVVVVCALGFWQSAADAQRAGGELPFANPVEQRQETNALLREIRDLLKEQNALLRSGKIQVTVSQAEKR